MVTGLVLLLIGKCGKIEATGYEKGVNQEDRTLQFCQEPRNQKKVWEDDLRKRLQGRRNGMACTNRCPEFLTYDHRVFLSRDYEKNSVEWIRDGNGTKNRAALLFSRGRTIKCLGRSSATRKIGFPSRKTWIRR